MSAQIARVMVPHPVAVPRGAAWASTAIDALLRLGNATWRELEAVGQARARRDSLRLARLHADRPDFARLLRDAAHRSVMSRD